MDSAAPFALTQNVYDRLNDRGFVLLGICGLTGLVALLVAAVAHPHYFIAGHDSGTLVIAWLLLVAILLAAPRIVFNIVQGFRGVPALRFGDEGIWSRGWPRLGWIKWTDVAAVVIVSGGLKKSKTGELRIELRSREYALLPWNDKGTQLLAWLLCSLFGIRTTPRELPLISSQSLAGSWDDLIAALEPVLLRNGVWKREERDK
jgi:hypothetical protein